MMSDRRGLSSDPVMYSPLVFTSAPVQLPATNITKLRPFGQVAVTSGSACARRPLLLPPTMQASGLYLWVDRRGLARSHDRDHSLPASARAQSYVSAARRQTSSGSGL